MGRGADSGLTIHCSTTASLVNSSTASSGAFSRTAGICGNQYQTAGLDDYSNNQTAGFDYFDTGKPASRYTGCSTSHRAAQ